MQKKNFGLSPLGGGAGLRHAHFDDIIAKQPPFKWFEIIVEDFMDIGGYVRESLLEIRRTYPIISHGVCLAVGSTDPLDMNFLKRLRRFLDEIKSPWSSDHLCFTMVDHTNLSDLIPLPFTKEAAKNAIERIKIIKQELARPFLVENVTRYVTVSDREMSESQFLNTVLEGADCGLLLDVTNVHLNSMFHGYDALEFIKSLPLQRVGQMHLAGWDASDGVIVDTHDAPVPPEVWALYKQVIALTGPTSALVEWDASIPPVERLLKESQMADAIMWGSRDATSLTSQEAA